jgi:hypothetical protein
MDYETAALISTIISCAISLIALVATVFSAAAAKESAAVARSALRQTYAGEILTLAQNIVLHQREIESLAADLKSSLQSLAVFRGGVGGSRQRLYENQITDDVNRALEISAAAYEFLESPSSLVEKDENSLIQISSNLRCVISELRAQKEKMARDLTDYRNQIQSCR